MKIHILMILLVGATVAGAQTAPKKTSPAARPVPTQSLEALRASATTNFVARCQLDPRWKAANAGIPASQERLRKIKERLALAKERAQAQKNLGQISKKATTPEVKQLELEEKTETLAMSNLKMQKLNLEDEIRHNYPLSK